MGKDNEKTLPKCDFVNISGIAMGRSGADVRIFDFSEQESIIFRSKTVFW